MGLHLSNVESGKAFFKDIPLDEKVEQVSSAHEFQYLKMRLADRESRAGRI